MAKNRIEFSAPLLLFLAFVVLFIPEPAGAGEKVVLPESISIKVVMMSNFGNRGDVKVDLNLAPSGYMFHSTRCSKGDKKIENREVEKLVELISTLRDDGEKATCCDHPWTEINLNYSSPPSHKKIMVGYDLLELKEIFNLCESPSVPFNPDNSQSQRRLGEQLYKIGLYDRAAEALERAVKLDPGHVAVETHEVLGDTHRMLRNYEKALEAYKRALGLRPESAELFLKLGSLYSESGRLPEAIEAYHQALHFASTGDTAYQAQASIGHVY